MDAGGIFSVAFMDRDGCRGDILDLHRAGESLPARRARDSAKGEAAEVRNRTAWTRVAWAIDGLDALLLLRDELLERSRELNRDLQDAGGLDRAPAELLDEQALRTTHLSLAPGKLRLHMPGATAELFGEAIDRRLKVLGTALGREPEVVAE